MRITIRLVARLLRLPILRIEGDIRIRDDDWSWTPSKSGGPPPSGGTAPGAVGPERRGSVARPRRGGSRAGRPSPKQRSRIEPPRELTSVAGLMLPRVVGALTAFVPTPSRPRSAALLRARGSQGSSRCPFGTSVWPAGSKILTRATLANWRSIGMISPAIVIVDPSLLQPPSSRTRATPSTMARSAKPVACEPSSRSPSLLSGEGPAKSRSSTPTAGCPRPDRRGGRRERGRAGGVAVEEEHPAVHGRERRADVDDDPVRVVQRGDREGRPLRQPDAVRRHGLEVAGANGRHDVGQRERLARRDGRTVGVVRLRTVEADARRIARPATRMGARTRPRAARRRTARGGSSAAHP